MNILLEAQTGAVLTLTLHRPEKRNALNPELTEALYTAMSRAMADDAIRVIILKGEGEAFCAGADLAYLQQIRNNNRDENIADSMRLKELYSLLLRGPKPVIAQVEGAALAGGCGLANACDFCFATPDATFGYTEVRIGFIPALVSVFLQRKINGIYAREILLTGRIIKAEEALAIGMVNALYAKDEIGKAVQAFADNLVRTASGSSIALTKELLWESSALGLDAGMIRAAEMNATARSTADCIRGIDAFLNKEKITWA
jgi:methylglutaconyl-CoA hydratase